MSASAWRSVGVPGVFADWVLDLDGYSGVYAIRDARSGTVLYVGESHTGRLYDTLTRHFQQSSNGYHGPNFDRRYCEVKIEILAPGDVEELQLLWIARLQPEHNELVPVEMADDDDDEEIPF